MPGRRARRALILLALALSLAVPATASAGFTPQDIYAVTSGTTPELLRFSNQTPNAITTIGPITGLQAMEEIWGIDFDPATGGLYAIGSTSRPYRIDRATAAASQLEGPLNPLVAPTLAGAVGFDIDPVSHQTRIVTDSDQNLRVNTYNGTLAGVDSNLAPDGANPVVNPTVPAIAYTNNYPGATQTTLFGYEYSADDTVRIGSPDGNPFAASSGVVFKIGEPGIVADGGTYGRIDLDASPYGEVYLLAVDNAQSNLYFVNTMTGAVTLIGGLGRNDVRDLAVEPLTNTFQLSQASYTVNEGDGSVSIGVTRSAGLGTASIGVATSEGTAVAPEDFSGHEGYHDFDGTSISVPVPIANDNVDEPDETFQVSIGDQSGGNAVLGTPNVATVTIVDDDAAPAGPPPPPPPPAPPAPPDTTAPTVRITGVPKSVTFAKFAKGVKVTVVPGEPAAIDAFLEATARRATIAKAFNLTLASRSLPRSASRRTVTLKPDRKLIGRRARKMKARVRVALVDGAGNRTTRSVTIAVKPR